MPTNLEIIQQALTPTSASPQPAAPTQSNLDIINAALATDVSPEAAPPAEKPSFFKTFKRALVPPIIANPPAALKRAKETFLSIPSEAKRLEDVLRPALGPVAEPSAALLSAMRGVFGIPFEALAQPAVTQGFEKGAEFISEKAPGVVEAGMQVFKPGFELGPEAEAIVREIAPDVVLIGTPIAGKSIAKARATGPKVRAKIRALAEADVRKAEGFKPKRVISADEAINEFTAKDKPIPENVLVEERPFNPKETLTDPDLLVPPGDPSIKPLRAVAGGKKTNLQIIKEALADAEKPPITTEPGAKGVSAEQGRPSRLGQEQVLFRDGEKPLIITEGSVDVSTKTVNGKKVKQALVKFDKLGDKPPEVLSTEGLTFESAKGRYAKEINEFNIKQKGLTPLEAAIGERTSNKQVKDFPTQFKDESLSLDVQKNLTDATVGFMLREKIPLSGDIPVSLQLVKQMAENTKLTEKFSKALEEVGLTREDFLKTYVSAKSIAGKTLAELSVAERRLRKELGDDHPLVKELKKRKVEMTGWDLGWHYANRWIDIWRGSLVTRVKTAVRNLETQAVRVGIDALERAVDDGIRKQFNLKDPRGDVPSMRPIFDVFRTLFSKERRGLVDKILELNPDIKDNMFRRYTSDLAFDPETPTGVKLSRLEKVTKASETVVRFQNTMNWWQEFLVRKTAFYNELVRRLDAKGIDLNKVDLKKLDVKDLVASAEHALDVTFAKTPSSAFAKGLLNVFRTVPPLKLVVPFARFMLNSWDFFYQRNPAMLVKIMMSSKERAAIRAGNTQALTKAMIGSAMTLTAYAIRKSDIANDTKWYQLRIGGRVWDMRPFNPFATYLFVADLADKMITGTLNETSAKEIVSGLFSANFRAGAGLYLLDNVGEIVNGLLEQRTPKAAVDALLRVLGETAGGFVTQIRSIKSVVQQFSEEEATVRDRRESPFLAPILEAIPFVSQTLPERQFPLGAERAKAELPLAGELTGLLGRTETPPQREASRLRLSLRDLQPGTGLQELDRLIAQHARPRAERRIASLLQSRSYQILSKPEQREKFIKVMREVTNTSRNIVLSRTENRELKKKFKDKKTGKRKLAAQEARRERLNLPPR